MTTSKLRAAAVILLVGFTLGLTAFAASRVFIRSILEDDASSVAAELAWRIAAGDELAPESLSVITRYDVLDANGRLVQSGGSAGDAAARPDASLAPRQPDPQDGPVSFASLLGIALGIDETPFRQVAVPLPNGEREGSLSVVVDQSAALERLSRALSLVAIVVVALAGLAGTIVAIAFSRGRYGEKHRRFDPSRLARDEVTGLLTRQGFLQCLEDVVRRASETDTQVGLLIVELSRFRAVNDTWGHAVGDQVLAVAAERIKAHAPKATAISRVSGASFAVTLEKDTDTHSLRLLAAEIQKALTEPFAVESASIALGARIGVALYPVNADTAEILFRAADVSLSRAKDEGKGEVRFFDTKMGKRMRRRAALERDLRRALEQDEFVLFYQPQLELASGKVRGYEALIRWERPGEGIVAPGDFLAVAEETGLIRPLGEWVLKRACEDAVTWKDGGIVSVNFSSAQFAHPDVDRHVAAVLAETGLAPGRLEIEVPESLFLQHDSQMMASLHRIKELGVRVAMDDFGTGYSGLASLSRFPFDKIKIDVSFVRQLTADPDVAAIVSSVVGLGRSLSVDVTAEGVETQEQVTLLKAAGCSFVQGFLFGVPQRASADESPIPLGNVG